MGALTAIKDAIETAQAGRKVLPAAERQANLQKFVAPSQVKDVYYHATDKDFKAFRPSHRDAYFATPSTEFANDFMARQGEHYGDFAEGANVMPVHIQAKNPFDYQNPQHVDQLVQTIHAKTKRPVSSEALDEIKDGDWHRLEDRDTMRAIKDMGHDSMFVSERDSEGNPVKNIGVFQPEQIKSAIGNQGTYDTSSPDLTKRKGGPIKMGGGGLLNAISDAYKASHEANLAKFLEGSKVQTPVYHGTTADFNTFKVGPRGRLTGGIYTASDKNVANVYANAGEGSNVMPLHMSLKNPANEDQMYAVLDQYPADQVDTPLKRMNLLKAAGYDGISHDISGGKGTSFYHIAFDPTQVKSAIGNAGTFDPTNPDITKKTGGRIHLSLKNPKLKEHIQAFGRGGGAHSDAPLSDAFTKGLVPMLAGAGKGAVSGILGAPGDLESMGRSAINALAPQESVLYESNKVSPETFLPTSESIANRLPMLSNDKTAQQVEKFGTSAGSNIAGAMVGPETLLKGKAIGSLADKLKSALNNSGKIKPLEKAYATTQDGPFYRVTPTSVHPSEAVDGGTRQKIWGTNATPDARTARESGSRDAASFSHEALKDVTNDPVQNLPWYLANKKVNEIHGRDYQEPKMPASSLVKQGPIARAFMAGANNEPGYKEAVFKAYQEQHPELVKQAGASNYDELLKASYEQLAKETKDQFNSLPYEFSFHRNGEGNYPSSAHMAADVHGNGHIYVYQGGDKHDFLHEVDPETGLNTNEMFRAVHDVFGHAIHGNQFGPKGEEIAWGAHQQMYSPLAVPAMSAETRGQNSVVNYSPLNAELKKDVNNIEERIQQIKWKGDTPDLRRLQEEKRNLLSTQFQYAPQASVLLPPEMLRPEYNGGMPEYLKPVIKPDPETTAVQNLYHFSHEPSLTETNPNRYGTGIKGAEAQRLEAPNAIKPRTYFYTDPSVTPEAGLGPYKYQSQANDLYNLQADPLKFYTLARETGREPFTAKVNAGVPPTAASVANDVERLANEYGYSGVYDPSSAKPAAAVFNPMPVQRQKRGGLAKENFNG